MANGSITSAVRSKPLWLAFAENMTFSLAAIPSVILVTILSLVQSFILRGHSLVGDGLAYTATYEALVGSGIIEGYEIFQNGLGASEFFSYIVFYLSAQLISYEAFIYITNLAFAYSIYWVYRRYDKGILAYVVTIPLNFYFLAVCFGAQRLKLGFFFLILALATSRPTRAKWFAFFCLFSHFQLVIIFAAERVRSFVKGSAKLPLAEVVVVSALAVGIFFAVPVFQLKVLSYVLERGEVNLLTFAASFLVAAYVSRLDIGLIAEFVFFLVVILIIGESRVNILVFCVLWRLIFLEQKRPVLVAYLISTYLLIKGVAFMSDIANGGTGFGDP